MWNLISCNKLTQDKLRRKSYDQHVENVRKMKSKMKVIQPQQPWFIYAKKKKQLARNQQLYEMQKQNHLLLAKISTIQKRDNQTFKRNSFLSTLNTKIINDNNQTILKENRRICQKILKTDSFYKTGNILESSNHLERVMQNISQNSKRVQSAKFIAQSKSKLTRPQSGFTSRPQSGFTSRPKSGHNHNINQFKTALERVHTEQRNSSYEFVRRPLSATSGKTIRVKIQLLENENVQKSNENVQNTNEN